ncbi:hypothetical protein EDM55_17865 [Brevibacillus centrosporus]|nr:hypothetical protein EDM55_17865 [Brevibacillus centrosporus]
MAKIKKKRSLFMLSLFALLLLLFFFPAWTPEIRDENGKAGSYYHSNRKKGTALMQLPFFVSLR